MLNIKTKIRLSVFTALLVLTIAVVVLVLKTLEDNIMYFYSPSEVKESSNIILNNNIRIGGMVKDGSVKADEKEIKFIVFVVR